MANEEKKKICFTGQARVVNLVSVINGVKARCMEDNVVFNGGEIAKMYNVGKTVIPDMVDLGLIDKSSGPDVKWVAGPEVQINEDLARQLIDIGKVKNDDRHKDAVEPVVDAVAHDLLIQIKNKLELVLRQQGQQNKRMERYENQAAIEYEYQNGVLDKIKDWILKVPHK